MTRTASWSSASLEPMHPMLVLKIAECVTPFDGKEQGLGVGERIRKELQLISALLAQPR